MKPPRSETQRRVDFARKERLLRLNDVLARIGYRRTRFLELVKVGKFPQPVRLPGGRAVAWPESVVDDLIDRIVTGKEI